MEGKESRIAACANEGHDHLTIESQVERIEAFVCDQLLEVEAIGRPEKCWYASGDDRQVTIVLLFGSCELGALLLFLVA